MLKYRRIYDFDLIVNFLLSTFSSPTHWPEWNLLVSKFFKTEFYYFGAIDGNKLVGICPVHKKKEVLTSRLISGQYHFIPNGGWLFNKFKKINLSDIPLPYNSAFECFALPALTDFKVTYTQLRKPFQTLIVDLRSSEEIIWNDSVDSKRRNMIRKAYKTGIRILKESGNLDLFFLLNSDSAKSKGLEHLPLNFFSELIQQSHNIKFIPFVAFNGEEPVAALGLIHDKDYSYYWLGATKQNSKNMGQGELLQWEAIKYSKSQGCKYYDLCYIEKERLPHIYQFKKGFSQTEVQISYLTRKTLMYRILNKLQKSSSH
ncbi:MAG: peptidoglycan bridge formation glycyltransferase FemA/FemB family protein [Bacteroidales bacterium]|nr:peptidoglycan bridge formation glycyltransferase FemA/FemB family protein [Bacteroidales bacterium]